MEPAACGVSGAETGLPAPLPEAWPVALCTFLLGQRFHTDYTEHLHIFFPVSLTIVPQSHPHLTTWDRLREVKRFVRSHTAHK